MPPHAPSDDGGERFAIAIRQEELVSRIRSSIVPAAAARTVIVPSSAAQADSADALQELRRICTMKGGTWVWTPYALARCQDSRSNKGFGREQGLCTELQGFLGVYD